MAFISSKYQSSVTILYSDIPNLNMNITLLKKKAAKAKEEMYVRKYLKKIKNKTKNKLMIYIAEDTGENDIIRKQDKREKSIDNPLLISYLQFFDAFYFMIVTLFSK
jgi:hypothetical protein